MPAEPLILDPELHPFVWKPWEEPPSPAGKAALTTGEDEPPAPIPVPASRPRPAVVVLSSIGVLAILAALLVPQLLPVASRSVAPLVADIGTQPEIVWSAEGGDRCYPDLDSNHAVLIGTDRLRSLDLRDGTTAWSVDMHGRQAMATCLPAANMVAVTETDLASNDVLRIRLFDGLTGEEVAELPGESTVQVIPLGPYIGLLDRNNMLRAFASDRLDRPLWSRKLPGPPGQLSTIWVESVDDDVAMLWYSKETDDGFEGDPFSPLLSVTDGETPRWSVASEDDQQHFVRVGDVLIRRRMVDEEVATHVLDLKGRELWSAGDAQLFGLGSRVYIASASSDSDGFGFQELREVHPRTGTPLGSDVYEGQFDYATPGPDGHIAVFQNKSVGILDKRLQEQFTIPVVDYGKMFVGEKLLYISTRSSGNSAGKQLLALEASGPGVLWTYDLDPGQEVEQMGEHLVVVDDRSASIHGLGSPS